MRRPTGCVWTSAWDEAGNASGRTPGDPLSTPLARRLFAAGALSLALVVGTQLAAQPSAAAPPPTTRLVLVEPVLAASARPTLSPAQRRAARQSAQLAAVVRYARAQVGKPYRYGHSGPRSFDCSGLTLASYKRAGIPLPHSSRSQARRGVRIPKAHRRPGDLIVWSGHVGLYVGGGKMIDAGSRRTGVSKRGIYGSPTYRRIANG